MGSVGFVTSRHYGDCKGTQVEVRKCKASLIVCLHGFFAPCLIILDDGRGVLDDTPGI